MFTGFAPVRQKDTRQPASPSRFVQPLVSTVCLPLQKRVALRCTMRVTVACVPLIAVLLVSSGARSTRGTVDPPSSLEPVVKHRVVRVSHRHQRTRGCVVRQATAGFTCSAQLEESDSTTTVTFSPSGGAVSSVSARRALVVTFGKRAGRQDKSIELALGRWSIDWPGARTVKYVDVGAGSSPVVALRTISGRCDPADRGCTLNANAISRRISVTGAQP